MKTILFLLTLGLFTCSSYAQNAGNAVYNQNTQHNYSNSNSSRLRQLTTPSEPVFNDFHRFSMRSLYNVKPKGYLAVFHLFQMGKTAAQANGLIQSRTDSVRKELIALGFQEDDIYLDMISFVPLYEVESENKLFSKKTYTEIPAGFEIKKNFHIRYANKNALDAIVAICARHEIYDLVKVDVLMEDIEKVKSELRLKSIELLKDNVDFQTSLGVDLSNVDIRMSESFNIIEPQERYTGYSCSSSTDLNLLRKKSEVKRIKKNTSIYYDPVSYTDFDLVVNPEFTEPVIQVVQHVVVVYKKKPKDQPKPPAPKVITETKIQKEVFFIEHEGTIKKLEL
ncbi:SIMPL domain-containing protein [bacterium SCSIO 12741]|nr:SIMPL domain-containing protein [bacterium SCSIO 12741]